MCLQVSQGDLAGAKQGRWQSYSNEDSGDHVELRIWSLGRLPQGRS